MSTIAHTTATAESHPNPHLSYWSDTTEGSTFQSEKLRWWTESHLQDADQILNPCAGVARLDVPGDVLRLDINEDADADLHIDFRTIEDHVEPETFDAIVYDPPYTWVQAVKKYDLDLARDEFYFYDDDVMEIFDRILKPGGIIIQFGYSTSVMPLTLGYETEAVALFNKLGAQNDYLATVARKPTIPDQSTSATTVSQSVVPNAGAENIRGSNVSKGGNGGENIQMEYRHSLTNGSLNKALKPSITSWLDDDDRVLHIYQDTPRFSLDEYTCTTCAYTSADFDTDADSLSADVIVAPWNIDSTFATGEFDAVVLDIPYEAFQRNIRSPQAEASSKSGVTHVDTILKRSITNLVKGNGGRVIQIGQTATLMSGADYDYTRRGVTITNHATEPHDWIIAVDEKPHENLEVATLGDGEVDGLYQHPHGAPNITDKQNRTDFEPHPDSSHCEHCGNSYFHHPAAYVDCPDCGAIAGNLCLSDSGHPINPSGADHRITESDVCPSRLTEAETLHDGSCNRKEPSYVAADDELVSEVTDRLPADLLSGEHAYIRRKHLEQLLEDKLTAEPRSTDIIERVIERLGSRPVTTPETNAPADTTACTLDEYL
jgi:hypothetical protein